MSQLGCVHFVETTRVESTIYPLSCVVVVDIELKICAPKTGAQLEFCWFCKFFFWMNDFCIENTNMVKLHTSNLYRSE